MPAGPEGPEDPETAVIGAVVIMPSGGVPGMGMAGLLPGVFAPIMGP
jgi:hypothetical protein